MNNLMKIIVLFSYLTYVLSYRSGYYYSSQHQNRQPYTNDGSYDPYPRGLSHSYSFSKLRNGQRSGRLTQDNIGSLVSDSDDNQESGSTEPTPSRTNPSAGKTRISESTTDYNSEDYEIITSTRPSRESDDNRPPKSPSNSEQLKAVAVLRGKAKGFIYFEQIGDKLKISGKIEGLTNGLHAFHVHDFGDLRKSCYSSGGHFNPFETRHGSPIDSVRHVGDLGNVFADESGVAKIDITDSLMSLKPGKSNVLGHAIIIHENVDDLGRGGHVKAGARQGCGIIGWFNELA